jgi:Peptidase family M41/C-terminal, D2-small domain, of ClpB protein
LRRADFVALIAREIDRIVRTTMERFGIEVSISDRVADLVYRNGVFPVQGVRPVFSSVADIIETNLATFVFEALMKGGDRVAVDHTGNRLVAKISKGARTVKTVDVPYVGRLDKVRQSATVDVVANVSVHEAGHAVAYAVLFGLAPLQLTSRVTSSYAAGFTFPHAIHGTRAQLIGQIKVYLAGGLAEELVFGRNEATIGRESDRESATKLALDYVRKYGFDEEYQATYTLEFAHAMDMKVTDTDAEKMLARLVAETVQLLAEHEPLLQALARELQRAGELKAPAVAEITGRFGVPTRVEPEAHLQLPAYAAALERTE